MPEYKDCPTCKYQQLEGFKEPCKSCESTDDYIQSNWEPMNIPEVAR